jgi:hypothetical protein
MEGYSYHRSFCDIHQSGSEYSSMEAGQSLQICLFMLCPPEPSIP